MAQTTPRERIEIRVNADVKHLAERASAAQGFSSLTDFITSLIRENAPLILQNASSIQLTNAQFDNFIAACEDTERQPSERLLAAAKRLDTEGF